MSKINVDIINLKRRKGLNKRYMYDMVYGDEVVCNSYRCTEETHSHSTLAIKMVTM